MQGTGAALSEEEVQNMRRAIVNPTDIFSANAIERLQETRNLNHNAVNSYAGTYGGQLGQQAPSGQQFNLSANLKFIRRISNQVVHEGGINSLSPTLAAACLPIHIILLSRT